MVSKKFKESENTAVFTTKFITDDNKLITLVKHNKEDGTWEFFSDDKYDYYETVAKIISIKEVLQKDSSISDVADLPPGYLAHRKTTGQNWIVEKIK